MACRLTARVALASGPINCASASRPPPMRSGRSRGADGIRTQGAAFPASIFRTPLARIIREGSDFGIDTKASAWYKCFIHRHLPTTEALA